MNTVKDVLKKGKAAIGTSASLKSPVDFLTDAGYDFLLFDTQHKAVEIKELQYQLQAMRGKRASPIIRVGENRRIRSVMLWTLVLGASSFRWLIPRKRQRIWSSGASTHPLGREALLVHGESGETLRIIVSIWIS